MMALKWILAIVLLSFLFVLPFLQNIISAVIATLMIFFCTVLFLFAINIEFTPIILMLLVIGAFIVLIVFTIFILNQHTKLEHYIETTSWTFTLLYFVLVVKLIIFFSSWDTFGPTQLSLVHQLNEAHSFLGLFDLSSTGSYGFMLLLIAFILFLLTVGISLLLKSK